MEFDHRTVFTEKYGPNAGKKYSRDYYTYAIEIPTLTVAAAVATGQISIDADSDFVWEKSSYFADVAGAAQTDANKVVPLVSVAITDSGSGRNLQNIPVPIDTIAGRAGLPFLVPSPRVFAANSNITLVFTNYSAATDYANLYYVFIGYKKFYF